MKKGEVSFSMSAISLAVRSALALACALPLAARAQDDEGEAEVKALICPTNSFDIGLINVPTDSQKFGEYNGLDSSGLYLLGAFDLRGGAYCGQSGDTMRWQATGSNLGTTSRNVGASVADQGHWTFGIGYDQLRHYTSNDSYQTPFDGSMGGNFFTLPADFGVINTTTTTSSGVIVSQNMGTRTMTPTQLAAFHREDVYTERENTTFNVGYIFNRQWNVKFDFRRLNQSGAKLIGSGTDAWNLLDSGGYRWGAERVAILMNPTDYKNDTFDISLNWVGKKAYASAAYYGSLFHDNNSGISWMNPYVQGGTGDAPDPPTGTIPPMGFPINTMSTPPSNSLHQVSLTGGYIFSPATKLVGGISYGRNTQNASYSGTYTTVPDTVPVLPVGSLDGVVVNEHADIKLTHQPTRALTLTAGFKFNERSNRTPSYEYTFLDLGGDEQTVVNIPMSNKRYQGELSADYRFNSHQRLHLGYEYDAVDRWCRNALANNAQGVLSDTNQGYYTVASCVQVPKNKENRFGGKYTIRFGESVDVYASYEHAHRNATVNASFYNPMQANEEGFENYGFLAFFDASRSQNLFKGGVTWQATNKLSLGLNGRRTKDNYDSTLGVQDGESASANLDASFSYSENGVISAYASWQKRTRTLLTASGRDALVLRPTLWSNDLADRDNTLGLSARQKHLLHGKLELMEDITYSLSKSKYVTTLVQNINPAVGNQGESPNVSSELTQVKISGAYELNRASTIEVGYLYQRLKSNDYYYNAYQFGFTPTTLLPTGQKAPDYSVNTVFAAYRYTFQ